MTVVLGARYVTKGKDHAEGGHILTPVSILGKGQDAEVSYTRSGMKEKGQAKVWWFNDHCINLDTLNKELTQMAVKLLNIACVEYRIEG